MKKSVILVLAVFCLSLMVFPATAAEVTEGEFAFALAQILGFGATTVDEAVAMLGQIRIQPEEGWVPSELMTEEKFREVELAISQAIAAGWLDEVVADGAVAAAAASVGFEYDQPMISPWRTMVIPWYAPIGGPLNDPVFVEIGEEEIIPPGPPQEIIEGSPFMPY